MRTPVLVTVLVFSLSCWADDIEGTDTCGDFSLAWDYTDPANWRPSGDAPQTRIKLVENVHFTQKVENLASGHTGARPAGDIEYTLQRFPNHLRALWALSRASRHPNWGKYTSSSRVRCFFERALTFKRDDPGVWMVYGMHLHKEAKYDEAEEKYREAGRLGLNSSDYHYNFGLLLAAKDNFREAAEQARIAYKMGYPLPGLRNKLSAAGYWP